MSPDLQVMVVPVRTYRQLLRDPAPVRVTAALARPTLAAMILGTSLAIWTTNHVTLRLVASLIACWSVVIALQVLAAIALIAPARRRVPMPAALDLFFVAHGPWSLWLMGSAVWAMSSSPIGRPAQFHMATSVFPAVWTWWLIAAFCRTVLECGRGEALWRTAIHQAIIWVIALLLFAFAVQLWPRILVWFA